MQRSIIFGIAVVCSVGAVAAPDINNSTNSAMYFHSQVRDAAICEMSASPTGDITFADGISNAAATCPDAFGWKQILGAIRGEFWKNWANDETVWVSDPKPICTDSQNTDCCFTNPNGTQTVGYKDASGQVVPPSDIGGPGQYCPYIPGQWGGATETTFAGGKPVTSHNTTFLREQDPARIARQREVEVVYRNTPFVEYTTASELYSKAGLAKLFAKVSGESSNSIPYRPTLQGASYPPSAVMFKADWIAEETMLELGYVTDHDYNPKTPPQNAEHPYITMKMRVKAPRSDEKGGKTDEYEEGLYYLASITGSSKALPNWHWYAFEHAGNKGRCDYTGCNDSYGFQTNVETISPSAPARPKDSSALKQWITDNTITFASNFITPNTISDQLDDGQQLFDLGKTYPSGDISSGLATLFAATGIGSGQSPVDPNVPSINDPAWQSYRLKGTQTQYYNNDGYSTIVGASITEGGFVNTSSCMSCHVQAAVNANGELGVPAVGGTGRLNLSGIGTVVNGHPVNADYYDRGTTNQRAVRVDFVWGILFAQ